MMRQGRVEGGEGGVRDMKIENMKERMTEGQRDKDRDKKMPKIISIFLPFIKFGSDCNASNASVDRVVLI